jgi:hypothetical protein
MIAKRISLMSSIVGLLAALFVVGGSNMVAADSRPSASALVGSWRETTMFPPEFPRPPLMSLTTFHADGTLTISDHGSITTIPGPPGAPPPGVFTAGHGVWEHLENRRFAYTAFELISDLSGNFVGYLKVRGFIEISRSGNRWTGQSFAEIFDTEDQVMVPPGLIRVTNEAQRIRIELPPR